MVGVVISHEVNVPSESRKDPIAAFRIATAPSHRLLSLTIYPNKELLKSDCTLFLLYSATISSRLLDRVVLSASDSEAGSVKPFTVELIDLNSNTCSVWSVQTANISLSV